MFDFMIAGVQAPIFLLVFVGFTVGKIGRASCRERV